jgi:hypothetical protein
MNKRPGFFRRVGSPIILTVGRSNRIVKTGDVILADFNSMMEKEGWKFEPRFDPTREKMEMQKVANPSNNVPAATESSNQLLQISDMKRRELTTQPRQRSASERAIDKRYDELVEANVIKLSSIAELDERAIKKQPEEEIVVNFDKLKALKKYSNKEWFAVSKEQCVAILTEAHIDFAHVKNEKWELVKFIKSVIKDIDSE